MNDFVFSQLLASIALVLGIACFQFKARKHVLLVLACSTLFNSAHFFVLSRPAPGAIEGAAAVRQAIAAIWPSRILLYIFVPLAPIIFLFTYQNTLSILGLLASLIATIGMFSKVDKTMRLSVLVASFTWMIHNVLAQTPVAALMEGLIFGSNFIGYWRFYLKKRDFLWPRWQG